MTRTRIAHQQAAALDQALQGMFRSLQNRPIPGRLASVVDQLDQGGDEARLQKSG